MRDKILEWLANGEVGLSSETIAFKMTGTGRKSNDFFTHPSDPDDFKRCLKLINQIPEIRERLHELKSISPYWETLVNHWNEVEESFMNEVPEWLICTFSQKPATKTYKLMKDIYAAVEAKTNDQKEGKA